MSEEEYDEQEHTHRLSGTMAMLSETYPIIVYYRKAVACGLPKHFMNLRFPPDKWGRVPCKRETMDWYLENSLIDEEAKKKIDLKSKDLEATAVNASLDTSTSNAAMTDGNLVTAHAGKKDGDKYIADEMEPIT